MNDKSKRSIEPVVVAVWIAFLLWSYSGFNFARAEGERCGCPPEPIIVSGPQNVYYANDIKEIQIYLHALGFYSGACTGRYDWKTVEALKAFQWANRIPETGNVDGLTWQALGDSVSGVPVSVKPPAKNLRIVIDLFSLSLTVMVDNRPFQSFPVAIGKPETPSPVGDWKIVHKGKWSGGFGTRWLGLNVPWGIYGIHGTNKPWSIGRIESHGCIRMFNRDIEAVFGWVTVGTPVHIVGDPFEGRRRLVRGERGTDVYFLQKRLRQLGYFSLSPDGIFGYETEKAVIKLQKESKIEVTGQVGMKEYEILRLLVRE